MVPGGTIIPLKHDLTWKVVLVQIHISEKFVARADSHGLGGLAEIMLVHAADHTGLMCQSAGNDVAAYPAPSVAATG